MHFKVTVQHPGGPKTYFVVGAATGPGAVSELRKQLAASGAKLRAGYHQVAVVEEPNGNKYSVPFIWKPQT